MQSVQHKRAHTRTQARAGTRALSWKESRRVGDFIHKCSSKGVNGCACERMSETASARFSAAVRPSDFSLSVVLLVYCFVSLPPAFFLSIAPLFYSRSIIDFMKQENLYSRIKYDDSWRFRVQVHTLFPRLAVFSQCFSFEILSLLIYGSVFQQEKWKAVFPF